MFSVTARGSNGSIVFSVVAIKTIFKYSRMESVKLSQYFCRVKLIFLAARVNLQLHCSASGRSRRQATDTVVLNKTLMTEALQGGQQALEQVNNINPSVTLFSVHRTRTVFMLSKYM